MGRERWTPSSSVVNAYGWRNLKLSNTKQLRAGLGSVGDQRFRLVGVGDSWLQGRGGNNSNDAGAASLCALSQLAVLLTASGIPARADSVNGWAGTGSAANYIGYNPKLAYTGAPIAMPGYAGPGFHIWQLPNAATATYTPGGTFDTVDIYFPKLAGQGTFTISDSAGVKATIDTSVGGTAMGKQTVTLAANSTYFTITASSNLANWALFNVRTAAAKAVEIINMGVAGYQLNNMKVAAGVSPFATLATLTQVLDNNAINVSLVNGWINDKIAGRTLVQASDDLRAVLTHVTALGGAMYMNYAGVSTATVTAADFALWSNTMMDIAANEFDLPVYDPSVQQPSYTDGNALALYFDGYHFRKGGQTILAKGFKRGFDAII